MKSRRIVHDSDRGVRIEKHFSHSAGRGYHSDTLKLIGTLPFPERIPYVLRFSRNGKWLLAAGGRGASAGKAVIWDVTTGKRVTEIGDEADIVLAADVSPNHKFIALGGPGKLIKIYDTATGELKHRIKKHTDWVTAMEFSPDGETLATGDRNGGAFIWDVATGGIAFTLGDHKDSIASLSWRTDSQMLATASEDGNGTQLSRLEGFTDLPSKLTFSHDGERLFVGDFTGTVRVWTVKDQKPASELTTNPD